MPDANHGCKYKRKNEIMKKKSKDKIVNSSPVSIFFDKYFLVTYDVIATGIKSVCEILESGSSMIAVL